MLYRGVRLDEAIERCRTNHGELNDLERAFLAASEALRAQDTATSQRRRRQTLVAAVTVAIVAVLLSGLAVWQWAQAETQRQIAVEKVQVAEEQRRIGLSRQLAAQALTFGQEHFDLGILLSVQAYRIWPTVEARRSLKATEATNPRLAKYLQGHTDTVWSVAFSPTASGSLRGIQTPRSASALVTGRPVGEPLAGDDGAVTSVVFSPDGGPRLRQQQYWRLDRTEPSESAPKGWSGCSAYGPATGPAVGDRLVGHENGVASVAFSPDGMLLASGSDDRTIRLWDPRTGQPIGDPLLLAHKGSVRVLRSPPTRTPAPGGHQTVRLWNVASRQPLGSLLGESGRPHGGNVTGLVFSSDGKTLYSGSDDRTVRRWDPSTGQAFDSYYPPFDDEVHGLDFLERKTFAHSGRDKTIHLLDEATRQAVAEPLAGHIRDTTVAFSPDGTLLASGSADHTIWLLHLGPLEATLSRSSTATPRA